MLCRSLGARVGVLRGNTAAVSLRTTNQRRRMSAFDRPSLPKLIEIFESFTFNLYTFPVRKMPFGKPFLPH